MTTYSSILAGKIPWTEEPAGQQLMGSQRVGWDWMTEHTHRHRHKRSWQKHDTLAKLNSLNLWEREKFPPWDGPIVFLQGKLKKFIRFGDMTLSYLRQVFQGRQLVRFRKVHKISSFRLPGHGEWNVLTKFWWYSIVLKGQFFSQMSNLCAWIIWLTKIS